MPAGRVLLALAADRLDWSPTWTRIDNAEPSLFSGFDIRRGKQTEEDTTDASTAVIYANDRWGYFDPHNGSSPFAGYLGKQVILQVRDPVTTDWVQLCRMWIDHVDFDIVADTVEGVSIVSNVQLHCVDIIGLLGRLQMDVSSVSGARVFGNDPTTSTTTKAGEGVVFYEDSSPGDGSGFDDRIEQILTDCGLGPNWYVVFTGNVDLLEGVYDVGESPLLPLQQAVDAEFPGLANACSDPMGRYCARGRAHRFRPLATWTSIGGTPAIRDAKWRWRTWKAGDGAAIALDDERAQIRPPLGWSYTEDKVRNVGFAYPKLTQVDGVWQQFPDELKPAQVFAVPGVDPFDRRVWTAENLLVKAGTTTGNTGAEEAKAFGEFWATVLATPRVRVDSVTLKSLNATDPRAAATWGLLLGGDISDVLNLQHGVAGGVGVSEDFYIEGSTMSVRALNPEMDYVERTFNLSPTAYYDDEMGLLG